MEVFTRPGSLVSQPRRLALVRLAGLLIAIVALGWLDYQTGPDIGFSLFYLLPIVAAGWFLGRQAAWIAAGTAAASWFVADYLAAETALAVTLWNTITRLVIYAAIGGLLAGVREQMERLQQANRELEGFSRSVSHDLRSPLIRIGHYSEKLEQAVAASVGPEGKRFLSVIRDTASEGLQLVDDLLEFAQIARTEIRRSAVDLDDMVAKLRTELVNPEEGRSIVWRVGPLPRIRGDKAMLEVAFRNLIVNALKFTRSRDVAIIEIGSIDREEGPVIFVRDNGVGFNRDYAHKLFAVFERLHGQSEFEGTGIGLAIVERIVARHEGRVWGEGAVGEGATFFVQLPLKR